MSRPIGYCAMVCSSVRGTPQGAVISPLLANIYLHNALDLWAHQWNAKAGNFRLSGFHALLWPI
jgi:retron-type reverse transcriptase